MKNTRKILSMLLILSILTVGLWTCYNTVFATESEWDENNKDGAWAVYYSTKWYNGNFMFSGTGSFARVDDKYKDSCDGEWEEVIGYIVNLAIEQVDTCCEDGFASKTEYKPLLMSIAAGLGMECEIAEQEILEEYPEMSKDGKRILQLSNYSENRLDDSFLWWGGVEEDRASSTDAREGIGSDTKAVKCMVKIYKNLIAAQKAYYEAYGVMPNIYSEDEALSVIIQASLYGVSYVYYSDTYSQSIAEGYYNENYIIKKKLPWSSYSGLANNTLKAYVAQKSIGHEIIG